MFIDGFLALCSTVGTGTCTEPTVAGYARQPISFGPSIKGVAVTAVPFTFGPAVTSSGTFAGRAIFDAPTAGNLLLVLPFPSARPPSARLSDAGDVGAIRLLFDALATYPNGDAFRELSRSALASGKHTTTSRYGCPGPSKSMAGGTFRTQIQCRSRRALR